MMKTLIQYGLVLFTLLTASLTHANDKVLMVLTSHSELGNTGQKTGFWLSELTHPYYAIAEAGYDIDVASIKGGMAPIDPKSINRNDSSNSQFFNDAGLMSKVIDSKKLADINPNDYRAIVFSGGHGTMWDLPNNNDVNRISSHIYENNGVVAAVCHGPAALSKITLSNGNLLIAGKKFAAFTNEEEQQAGLANVVPFLLQTRLEKLGGEHVYAKAWSENVVVSDRVITGQNPQSAHKLGEMVVSALQKKI